MPITRSAKKALRQNIRRRVQNIEKKEDYKKTLKEYRRLIAEKKLDEAKTLLSSLHKKLDKAAKTSVISPRKAARLKSRAAHRIAASTSASS